MAGLGHSLAGDYTGPRAFDAANTVRASPARWTEIQTALAKFTDREGSPK
jgi:hypothetical protein